MCYLPRRLHWLLSILTDGGPVPCVKLWFGYTLSNAACQGCLAFLTPLRCNLALRAGEPLDPRCSQEGRFAKRPYRFPSTMAQHAMPLRPLGTPTTRLALSFPIRTHPCNPCNPWFRLSGNRTDQTDRTDHDGGQQQEFARRAFRETAIQTGLLKTNAPRSPRLRVKLSAIPKSVNT